MEVPDEMLAAKDALAAALSAALPFLPGVRGVDVGLRQDGVELTDELAVSGTARASVGDLVRKRGRTTDLTLGRVSAIGLAPLGIGTPANSFEIYARDITAPILCKPGDNGSLVVNEQDEVVGILTQKGIEYSRIVTIGSPPDGAISGFATQMASQAALVGAADSVGISF